ncbi:PDDEXK-like family protein [Persephonella sp.]
MDILNYEEKLSKFFQSTKDTYKEINASYEEKLKAFFTKASIEYKAYKKIKKEIDRYLSTDFNLIEIIQPDENKISDVIKLLLEPDGVHGQGVLFLKIFLKKLEGFTNKDIFIDFSKVEIEREKTTSLLKDKENRRIDLLIKSNSYVIGIENKPWAGEQENQLEDYFNYLKELSRSKEFLLIYLHGFGEKPKSISEKTIKENSDKFLFTSYRKFLIPWLNDCYKECESQKVRFFLKDFKEWILKNFRDIEEGN